MGNSQGELARTDWNKVHCIVLGVKTTQLKLSTNDADRGPTGTYSALPCEPER